MAEGGNAGNRAKQHRKLAHFVQVFRTQQIQLRPGIQQLGRGQRRRGFGNAEKLREDRAQLIALGRESPAHKTWPRIAQKTSTKASATAPACADGKAPRENPLRAAPARPHRQRLRVSAVTGTSPSSSKNPIRVGPQLIEAQASRSATGGLTGSRGSWPRKRAKQQRNVAHGARHGTDSAQNRERAHARRQMPAAGNAARRGLERTDAGKVRRHPHRSAAVAAQPARRKPRRNGCRLAAARSARRPLQIPGIPRCARAADSRSRTPSGTPGNWSCPESTLPPRAAAPPPPHLRAGTSPLCSRLPISHRYPASQSKTSP